MTTRSRRALWVRSSGWTLGGVAIAMIAASLGCGSADYADAGGVPRSDAMSSVDGGPEDPSYDAGPLADAGTAPALAGEYTGTDRDDASGCFDGADADGDLRVDCADDECRGTPICCVGSSDVEACCAPGPATSIALSGCPRDPRDCAELGGRVVSGTPIVSLDHALVPVAGRGVDGALDFPAIAVSPRAEAVQLVATIAAPASSVQLDATAFGLWVPQLPTASVTPLVAVVVSATRGDVTVVASGRTIDTLPLPEGAAEYRLAISPQGLVTVSVGATTATPFSIALPRERVVPIVFGRVENDAFASGTTRLLALRVERSPCDLPAALVRDGAALEADVATLDETQVSDPSVLLAAGGTRVAFVGADDVANDERSLYVGALLDGQITDVTTLLTVAQLREALTASDVVDLGGPHLYEQDGVVSAYFAFEQAGRWRLGRLRDLDGDREITALATPDGSFDDPAQMSNTELLARERLADGGSRIVLFNLSGDIGTALAGGLCAAESSCVGDATRADGHVVAPSSDAAFDRDEVRAPFAVVQRGVTRIYYAGRRGTRWGIGVAVRGHDGTFFRAANDGAPVLTPSASGPDAIGVSGPSVFVDDGTLTLLYAGSDGARSRLMWASMPIRE